MSCTVFSSRAYIDLSRFRQKNDVVEASPSPRSDGGSSLDSFLPSRQRNVGYYRCPSVCELDGHKRLPNACDVSVHINDRMDRPLLLFVPLSRSLDTQAPLDSYSGLASVIRRRRVVTLPDAARRRPMCKVV